MNKYSRKKDVLFVAIFLVLVFLLVWVLTAEGPAGDYYAYVFGYGNTITMKNREVAEVYGIKAPGVYLVNKEGEAVAPVRGGLKMVFKGLIGADGRELQVGLRGVRIGLKLNPLGMAFLIVLSLILGSLIVFRLIVSRGRKRH